MGLQENISARIPRDDGLVPTIEPSMPSIYGVSRGFNHLLLFHQIPFCGIAMWLNDQGAAM
jgi:hypothetical protein